MDQSKDLNEAQDAKEKKKPNLQTEPAYNSKLLEEQKTG